MERSDEQAFERWLGRRLLKTPADLKPVLDMPDVLSLVRAAFEEGFDRGYLESEKGWQANRCEH